MNVIRKFFPYGMDKQEDGTWGFFQPGLQACWND